MRKLAVAAALNTFILDLVYLFARLSANDLTKAFAPPVEQMLTSLEAIDRSLREAQKAVVMTQARRDHLDDMLDVSIKRSGKLTEAVFGSQQSPEFRRVFPEAPYAIARLSWQDELTQVKFIAQQLESSCDAMLTPLAAPLRAQAEELEAALEVFKNAFTPLATARAERDYLKVETNVLREKVYGQLLTTFPGERTRVERFFRESEARERTSEEPGKDAREDEVAA